MIDGKTMLVVTRRVGEQVFIDKGNIQVKILFERNGIVALAIKAPPHIDVDRQEIFLRKQASAQYEQLVAKNKRK